MPIRTTRRTFLKSAALSSAALGALPVRAAAGAGADWRHYGGTLGATRYSELDQINRANVAGLKVAWVHSTGDSMQRPQTKIECTPIVVDGRMYVTTAQVQVRALDAATGGDAVELRSVRGDSDASLEGRQPRRCVLVGRGRPPDLHVGVGAGHDVLPQRGHRQAGRGVRGRRQAEHEGGPGPRTRRVHAQLLREPAGGLRGSAAAGRRVGQRGSGASRSGGTSARSTSAPGSAGGSSTPFRIRGSSATRPGARTAGRRPAARTTGAA